MKIYLASSFKLKSEVQKVHDALVAAGHSVPDVWWNIDLKSLDLPDQQWYRHKDIIAIAERHWKNIREADVLVIVSHPTDSTRFTGANIELGYAHGRGVAVFSIGAIERSAMYVPVRQTYEVAELVQKLSLFEQMQELTA